MPSKRPLTLQPGALLSCPVTVLTAPVVAFCTLREKKINATCLIVSSHPILQRIPVIVLGTRPSNCHIYSLPCIGCVTLQPVVQKGPPCIGDRDYAEFGRNRPRRKGKLNFMITERCERKWQALVHPCGFPADYRQAYNDRSEERSERGNKKEQTVVHRQIAVRVASWRLSPLIEYF